MLFSALFNVALLTLSAPTVFAAPTTTYPALASESVGTANQTVLRGSAAVVPTVAATVNGVTVVANTSVTFVHPSFNPTFFIDLQAFRKG
jgi:hypothetical protein